MVVIPPLDIHGKDLILPHVIHPYGKIPGIKIKELNILFYQVETKGPNRFKHPGAIIPLSPCFHDSVQGFGYAAIVVLKTVKHQARAHIGGDKSMAWEQKPRPDTPFAKVLIMLPFLLVTVSWGRA